MGPWGLPNEPKGTISGIVKVFAMVESFYIVLSKAVTTRPYMAIEYLKWSW